VLVKKKTNYISNRDTMAEVWKSKLSYCAIFEPLPQRVIDCDFDHSGTELVPEGLCRVFTYDHIPDNVTREGRHRTRKDKIRVNFVPFAIYLDGREIARSHWSGDAQTGRFDARRGQLTRDLALQIQMMATRIGRRGNYVGYTYNDEMVGSALVGCLENALRFDDTRTSNPFAFFTTVIDHEFKRYLTVEKRSQQTRDALLFQAGVNPSYSSEAYH